MALEGLSEIDLPVDWCAMARPADSPTVLERVIRRDQWLLGTGVFVVAGLAWVYLYRASVMMHSTAAEAAEHAAMGMDMPGADISGCPASSRRSASRSRTR